MTITTVSAPGKLMLLGEHAVVYNRPCLVTSVDQRLYLQAEYVEGSDLEIEAEGVNVIGYKRPLKQIGTGNIPKGAQFIEYAVRNFSVDYPISSGIRIKTKSDFSASFGFGSSSATAVCTVKALSELLTLGLEKKDIFKIAYKTVLDVQGKGSGFDIASAIYGGTLYYLTGGKEIEPLDLAKIPMIIGYTGIKADTTSLIAEVAERGKIHGNVIDFIYSGCEVLVKEAKECLKKGEWKSLGELMNFNQGYLEALGVSTKQLSAMIYAAREAGAYGAKLSGAGGGDCMIAIADEKENPKIVDAITEASGKDKDGKVIGEVISITTGVDGVRVEERRL